MSSVGDNGTADLVPPENLVREVMANWPWSEWSNAIAVSLIESGWDQDAVNDTTSQEHPCGTTLRIQDGAWVTAERSVGWFQLNLCNYPAQDHEYLSTPEGNTAAAAALWRERSWQPWYFSATHLGLL